MPEETVAQPELVVDAEPIVEIDGQTTEPTVTETKPAETKAEVTEETGDETKTEEKKPHKTGSQRARERADREAQARIAAEQRLAAVEAQLNAQKAQIADPNEPKIEDFEDFNTYRTALVNHAQKKASDEVEQRFKADQARRDFEAKQTQWQARDAEFSKDKADWDDAMEDLTETVSKIDPRQAPGFAALDAALTASDLSSALKYHLGKNPEDLTRMARLDPISAVKELTKLEIKIGSPSPEPTKPKTNAPKPVIPVTAPAGGRVLEDGLFVY